MEPTNKSLDDRFAMVSNQWDKSENETANYYKEFLASVSSTQFLCVFGAGTEGGFAAEMLVSQGLIVDFYCDNSEKKWCVPYKGLNCISPQQLCDLNNDVTVVISTQYYAEIFKQLCGLGILHIFQINTQLFPERARINNTFLRENKTKIIQIYSLLQDAKSKLVYIKRLEALTCMGDDFAWEEITTPLELQYFDPDVVNLSDHEVFVDGGAYDGDTLLSFLSATKNIFDGIYSFELDPENFVRMQKTIEELSPTLQKKIHSICKGLYKEQSSFLIGGSGESSNILSKDTVPQGYNEETIARRAYVTSIDEEIRTPVSFIKMDVEGAELNALIGAKNTIMRDKPKLAICLYHKIDDLWNIPLFINQMVPSYRFYMRHYTKVATETVLYALPI